MAAPTLFHYPNCSTCRKARKWLDANGVEVKLVDIVQAPPSKTTLAQVKKLADVEVRKLFNTSGQSYRQGGWKDKLPDLSQDEALTALAADGKLIKRPILLGSDYALVGFKADAYEETLA